MSRYPSTQFISIDNSAISNAVAITPTVADAPTYMYAFRSEKGPEDIKVVSGKAFYDLYGAQSRVLFDKYGQPLLQASMNINNGANLICKRAVLDDAKLANATFAISVNGITSEGVVKKYVANDTQNVDAATMEATDKDVYVGHIKSITNDLTDALTITPVIYNTRDTYEYDPSDNTSPETKNIYRFHKEAITDIIENGSYIPVSVDGEDGIINGSHLSSGYLKDYITSTTEGAESAINKIVTGFNVGETSNSDTYVYRNIFSQRERTEVSVSIVNGKLVVEASSARLSMIETIPEGTDGSLKNAALTELDSEIQNVYNKIASLATVIFPIFTVFDNGRGVSTKSIKIEFDVNSTRSVGNPIYKLAIYDDVTNTSLESYYFCLNPYVRNSVSGFTYDIESQVNYNSNQINAVTHYNSYDALVNMLSTEHIMVNSYVPNNVLDMYDCLFGHDIRGKAITSITNDQLIIKKNNYIENIVSATNVSPKNMSEYDSNVKNVISYVNTKNNIVTYKLIFGFDGEVHKTKEAKFVSTSDPYYTRTELDDNNVEVTVKYKVFTSTGQGPSGGFVTPHSIIGLSTEWVQIDEKSTYDINGNLITTITQGRYIGTTNYDPQDNSSAHYEYELRDVIYKTTIDDAYQEQYYNFFVGKFDRNIYNLDIYFPNFIWDANYSPNTKIAIQRMAAIRGDMLAYMDMGINKVTSCEAAIRLVSNTQDSSVIDELPLEYVEGGIQYISDRHAAVTSLNMKIRDPYTNRVIDVTGTYNLSNTMIKFFINGAGRVFAGIGNGISITNIIPESVNYVPKVYPTDNLRSLSQINNTYISDDDAIINEPQRMCDARINYASYYNNVLTIDTEYTLNPTDSEYSYINNVVLVNSLMQEIRKKCPQARYNFLDANGMEAYQKAVEGVLADYRPKFATLNFKYLEDENSIQNKTFYAAIEVSFRPFAQAEIFTITALNYSVNSGNGVSI